MENFDIVICGGGASGLSAAITAADTAAAQQKNLRIAIVERLDRIGKKLLATGNGHCNLSNRHIGSQYYQSSDQTLLGQMLVQMPTELTEDFFADMGMLCEEEEDGRIFPYSRRAATVVDVFLHQLAQKQIEIICGFFTKDIAVKQNGFIIYAADGRKITASRLILAAGGKAAPKFGTDGSGYQLAKLLGHTILPSSPQLVPIKCGGAFPSGLKGLRINGCLTLSSGGKIIATEQGEILFTEYGISGIPALQLSCYLCPDTPYQLEIDFFPDISQDELAQMLDNRCLSGQYATAESLLLGTIDKKAAYAVIKSTGIERLSLPTVELTPKQRARITAALKCFRFPVTGVLSWNEAQLSSGGVPLAEIDTETCRSNFCSNAYITGELLAVSGLCGGYNLHWAWCTGMLAARAAVQAVANNQHHN